MNPFIITETRSDSSSGVIRQKSSFIWLGRLLLLAVMLGFISCNTSGPDYDYHPLDPDGPDFRPTHPGSINYSVTQGKIHLKWLNHSAYADRFILERSVNPEEKIYTVLDTLAIKITDYTDSSGVYGSNLHYRISAYSTESGKRSEETAPEVRIHFGNLTKEPNYEPRYTDHIRWSKNINIPHEIVVEQQHTDGSFTVEAILTDGQESYRPDYLEEFILANYRISARVENEYGFDVISNFETRYHHNGFAGIAYVEHVKEDSLEIVVVHGGQGWKNYHLRIRGHNVYGVQDVSDVVFRFSVPLLNFEVSTIRIRAVQGDTTGYEATENIRPTITSPEITNIITSEDSENSFTLTFSVTDKMISRLILERSINGGSFTEVMNTRDLDTDYIENDADKNSEYSYRVRSAISGPRPAVPVAFEKVIGVFSKVVQVPLVDYCQMNKLQTVIVCLENSSDDVVVFDAVPFRERNRINDYGSTRDQKLWNQTLTVSNSGNKIAAITLRTRQLLIKNTNTGEFREYTLPANIESDNGWPPNLYFTGNGRYLLAAQHQRGLIAVLNIETGEFIYEENFGVPIQEIRISPELQHIVIRYVDIAKFPDNHSVVRIYDPENFNTVCELTTSWYTYESKWIHSLEMNKEMLLIRAENSYYLLDVDGRGCDLIPTTQGLSDWWPADNLQINYHSSKMVNKRISTGEILSEYFLVNRYMSQEPFYLRQEKMMITHRQEYNIRKSNMYMWYLEDKWIFKPPYVYRINI